MKNEPTTKMNLGNPSGELANEYFFWLCTQVERRNDRNGFRELASLLHSTTFKSLNPKDDNRASDGRELRERFSEMTGRPNPVSGPCSVLEMLVALACKMDFTMTDDPGVYNPEKWFWIMIENLGFRMYETERNTRIIQIFLNRQYQPDGRGGLFPLRRPQNDQRDVEIWYQFMAYASENYS